MPTPANPAPRRSVEKISERYTQDWQSQQGIHTKKQTPHQHPPIFSRKSPGETRNVPFAMCTGLGVFRGSGMSGRAQSNSWRLDGLLVAGDAVILTGAAARCALQAALIAIRARRTNGLPASDTYQELATALARVESASGHSDIREEVGAQDISLGPTVPLTKAAARLGLTDRQVRRLAPRLGGRKICGRWLIDEQALEDHIQGRQPTWS